MIENRSEAFAMVRMLAWLVLMWFSIPVVGLDAQESGTFEGTLNASGTRQIFDFMEGRTVFTFSLEGHVNLKRETIKRKDFWARWIGIWDTETGGSARLVWDDTTGQKIFIVVDGIPMEKGATLTGELVGGTGDFSGIQGRVTFSWTSISLDSGDEIIAGYADDVKGSYRIP
jgi:hypothetical protein